MLVLVVVLALFAGTLTTVAGMGGGLILTLGLSTVMDPLTALTITAPALLLGNGHRLWLYRGEVDRSVAVRVAIGAAPGALLGGLAATALPEVFLRVAMIAIAVLASAKVLAGISWKPPKGWFVPGGALGGFVTATSGGGGLLLGPLLLASGLSGPRYIATAAVGAIAVHVGRMVGYGLGSGPVESVLHWGLIAAVAIATGNLIGAALRRRMPLVWAPRVELGAILTCLSLSLLGFA